MSYQDLEEALNTAFRTLEEMYTDITYWKDRINMYADTRFMQYDTILIRLDDMLIDLRVLKDSFNTLSRHIEPEETEYDS